MIIVSNMYLPWAHRVYLVFYSTLIVRDTGHKQQQQQQKRRYLNLEKCSYVRSGRVSTQTIHTRGVLNKTTHLFYNQHQFTHIY